jgi:Ca2+/H+ antiporter
VHAVVMLVLHGLAGLCIVVGAFRERESEFQVEGAKAFLAVLIGLSCAVSFQALAIRLSCSTLFGTYSLNPGLSI